MRTKPLVQIALDTLTVEEALRAVEPIREQLDVLEVGTILLVSAGKEAIVTLKRHFPEKIIVADGKIADAGGVFAKMFFEAGADYITCICAAEYATIQTCVDVARSYGAKKEVQIELTSHFDWQQVEVWRKLGVKQVVYHRARDAQLAGQRWSQQDLVTLKRLSEQGFALTITGGVVPEDIEFFQGINVHIFIAGRFLREASDPLLAIKTLKERIDTFF